MEDIDDLYGDLGQEHRDSPVNYDEESVDIYSGLENSPKNNGKTENVCPFQSPQRLSESMDLYEEIIAKEQQEKEATYNELKNKFDAAQNQIKELLLKLQEMQTKNLSLHTENTRLKKNISALIKTARMEILRKDDEINRLNQRPGRSGRGQSFQRPQLNCLNNKAFSRHNVKDAVGLPARPESQNHREESAVKDVSQPQDRHNVDHMETSLTQLPPLEKSRRSGTDCETPSDAHKTDCTVLNNSSTLQPRQVCGPIQSNTVSGYNEIRRKSVETEALISTEGDKAKQKASKTRAGSAEGSQEANKDRYSKEVDRTEKAWRESGKHSSEYSKNRHRHPEDLGMNRESERTENALYQAQTLSQSCVSSRTRSSKDSKDRLSRGSYQESRHHHEREGGGRDTARSGHKNRSPDSSNQRSFTEKTTTSLDHKTEHTGTRDHHRKEEKRQEDGNSRERRSSRSEKGKEYEREKAKDRDRSTRDIEKKNSEERRNTRSEKSKEYERRNRMTDRSGRETTIKTDEKMTNDRKSGSHSNMVEKKRGDSYPDRKDQDKGSEKRKTSCEIEEEKTKSKKSSTQVNARNEECTRNDKLANATENNPQKKTQGRDRDRSRGKGCLEDKEQKERRSESQMDAEVDSHANTAVQPNSSDDSHCSKKGQDKNLTQPDTQILSRSEASVADHRMSEEDSPNRKLSFMETLNLTLSPIKKQNQQSQVQQQVGAPSEECLLSKSAEQNSSLGEEFLIIDETEDGPESETMDVDSDPSLSQAPENTAQPDTSSSVTESTGAKETECSKVVDLLRENKDSSEIKADAAIPETVTTAQEVLCQDEEMQDGGIDEEANILRKSPNSCSDSRSEISQTLVKECLSADSCLPPEGPRASVCENLSVKSDTIGIQNPHASVCLEDLGKNIGKKSLSEPHSSPTVHSRVPNEDVPTSVTTQAPEGDVSENQCSVSVDAVSSTVGIHHVSQCHGNVEQMVVIPVKETETRENSFHEAKLSEGQSTAVPSVSVCTPKGVVPSTQLTSKPAESPVKVPKDASTSEPDSTEKELQNPEPSSSVPLIHDEDSMMLTLRNIKVIPDAISPLTSPVRQVRKVQPHRPGKQPHVKSLGKDFSSLSVAADASALRMDMNKENKRPDSSLPTQKDLNESALRSSSPEELEEGEIVSDEEEEEEEVPLSQSPPSRKEKSSSATGNQRSPKSPRLAKRASEMSSTATPKCSTQSNKSTTMVSTSSPNSQKRRFKTVLPPSAKTAISTVDEFMNVFKMIRMQIRKKYMKLHKTFSKTTFCSVIDMSLASFTEYVDSVNFDKLCSQGADLKTKLKNVISAVMSKVSDNGIVSRIFEQQAQNLKQKLWNFVDGQFDFLFKEVRSILISSCRRSKGKSSAVNAKDGKEVVKEQEKASLSVVDHRTGKKAKEVTEEVKESPPKKPPNTTPSNRLLSKCGLGSRGKNIRVLMEKEKDSSEVQTTDQTPALPSSDGTPTKNPPASADKMATYARRLSHSGSIQDKSDFEILTEQQTSSLTFNLVTDSQMGEIFKCLLQGSDLLDCSGSTGDNQNWPVGTPRKDGSSGENLTGVITPSKSITPTKLLASWSTISPCKFTSPNSKIQMSLNPALLDESCLLEVPSNLPPLTAVNSQRSFSILSEDLAVSLTIPSPLKSDNHLSFLQPANGEPLSAPDSVISAHFSEDALLEGEDATEQDIHLSLDTDNSSCGSSTGRTWEGSEPSSFRFKSNVPMQAEVMEKSNDHFIVRIRSTSAGPDQVTEGDLKEAQAEVSGSAEENNTLSTAITTAETQPTEPQSFSKSPTELPCVASTTHSLPVTIPEASNTLLQIEKARLDKDPAKNVNSNAPSTQEEGNKVVVIKSKDDKFSRKRKKHHSETKAKRSKTEEPQSKHHKLKHKKKSKDRKERGMKTPTKKESKVVSPQLSPNSLSAKNVVRKKGEVVMTWTRDEDRDILVELKMKGASTETFSSLAERINKSPSQIAERVAQLMKLFKKKEKMAS
ncbi:CASP8-associated protein 2 [Chanos chanos]|uniref:CASP8-associated protein 2 n=1 Tax=Chanos chanos TaxID=29144 RepID=A0A6J2W3S7_CHACN|nr:CASP8-associated protein 2 [Chanos chanos]